MLPIADESGIYPVILPAPGNYQTDEPEGKVSVFGALEGGGGTTDGVSGLVAMF